MLSFRNPFYRYYIALRPQTNEIHSVHKEGCPFMPDDGKRIYLGLFRSGSEASRMGRKYFQNSSGCRFCSRDHSHLSQSDTLMLACTPTARQLLSSQNGYLYYLQN